MTAAARCPRPRRLILAAAIAGLGGCSAGSAAPTSQVRDSAGTTVVTSTAPASADVQRLAAPALEIGGDGAAVEFGLIVAAYRQRSGHIIVADRGTSRIYRFDADGGLVATIGQKGRGPGEYERIIAAYGGPGDSIHVFDGATRRLTVLGPDGTLARSALIDLAEGRSASALFGVFPDGRLVASSGTSISPDQISSGLRRDSVGIAVVERSGESTVAGRFPSTENVLDIRTAPGQPGVVQAVSILRLPFGRSTAFGQVDTLVMVAAGDRFEVELYSAAGRLVRRLVRPKEPAPVTADDRERLLVEVTASLTDPEARARRREQYESVTMPATMPAYDLVVPTADGEVWVRDYLGPWARERPGTWTVFDPSGQWRTTVETPAGIVPTWIGDGMLVGTWLDADDIPRVRVYRVGSD